MNTNASNTPSFTLDREIRGDLLAVRFSGTADILAIEPLDSYLSTVHAEALAKGVRSVEVDFRELEFMNSSCFKCFVTWIGNVHDLSNDRAYDIVFRSNRAMHWQRRSLNALRCFAVNVVTVQQT